MTVRMHVMTVYGKLESSDWFVPENPAFWDEWQEVKDAGINQAVRLSFPVRGTLRHYNVDNIVSVWLEER